MNTINISALQDSINNNLRPAIDLNTAKVSYPGDQDLTGYQQDSDTTTFDATAYDLSVGLATKEPANANIQQHITNDGDLSATNELQDLTYAPFMDKGIMNISSGTGDTIPLVDNTYAGLMAPSDKNKLDSLNNGTSTLLTLNADSALSIEYGALYNWWAINDARGLVPSGYSHD